MMRTTLLRAPPRLRTIFNQPPRRFFAFDRPPPSATSQTRIQRFNRRLPGFLHKYTDALATAPLSHISSFLILHEVTAIIPLFGLAATFHYAHWLPPWFTEGAYVLQGVERFGKYFRKKGWIRAEDAEEAELEVETRGRDKVWNFSEGGVRVVVEFATAYAVTKVLLPVRIVASVWATPWFATRAVLPIMGRFKKVFRKGASNRRGSGGAGAGAGAGNGSIEAPKSGTTGKKY